ncbi:zinc-ribbon domain-containing protein [Sansalvadorimonas sp. 2012CJ34-2]|uniref:Zinc-ribbon domain-containing protein n=1 Tax=Parendozoicomonas callyspongiae TaxID=2942213 RepID=A0ABT0PH44_9GAMM|nr:DUF3426 domain-containing protein [Sansalvadorimonas sp. 2012CJ34-2]MCL6270576.1 zinc-ribbon domain-containing protein [Sansalvadorimonas sp. 2012CJ34-2]
MQTTPEKIDQKTWITRCPECHTAFRINKAHVQAAHGSVRCGSCLHVFKASENMLTEDSSFQELISQSLSKPAKPSPTNNTTDTPKPAPEEDDEEWARQLLEELEINTKQEPDFTPDMEQEKPEDIKEEPAPASQEETPSLDNLDSDPIQLHYQKKNKLQPALWSIASLLAVVLLAGQYVQANFNTLAFDQSTRPALTSLCSLVGCTVPELRDSTLIKASQVVLRHDQEYQNTLDIDTIITNTASFDQAYPPLRLTVLDSAGNIIGSRILQPEAYLSGEVAGARVMESEQPVHISFRVISPGKGASSVNVEFL